MASANGTTLISTILPPMAAKAKKIITEKVKPIVRSMAAERAKEIIVVDKIEREISNLQNSLRMVKDIVQVAEQNQSHNVYIRNGLRHLVNIGYEARDVLDDFITFSSCIIASNPVNFTSLLMLSCVGWIGGSSSDTSIIPLAFLNRLRENIRSVRERFEETFETLRYVVEGGSENVQSIIATNAKHNLTGLKVDGNSGNAFPNCTTSGNNVANLQSLGPGNYLRKLEITDCHELQLLKLDGLMSLKHLVIENCSKLACITPSLQVASTVERISISKCENLTRIDCESLPSLAYLLVLICDEIDVIPHLVSIEKLTLHDCGKLKTVTIDPQGLVKSLTELDIDGCPRLESIYEEGLTSSSSSSSSSALPLSIITDNQRIFTQLFNHELVSIASITIRGFNRVECFGDIVQNRWNNLNKLVSLVIDNCRDLKSLSPEFHDLPSLKELEICSCRRLESLPDGGLPDSLQRLEIRGCPLLYERYNDESGPDWDNIRHVRRRLRR